MLRPISEQENLYEMKARKKIKINVAEDNDYN
jgi:hypothetical protein